MMRLTTYKNIYRYEEENKQKDESEGWFFGLKRKS